MSANYEEKLDDFAAEVQGRADYDAAVEQAVAAAIAYEQSDEQLMSDVEFDALLARISAYETRFGLTDTDHGLFARVGHGGATTGDVQHPTPMLSLDKPGDAAVRAFAAAHPDGIMEPKIDGLAIRAVYRDGKLVQAVRRGDGTTGEDVTSRMIEVQGLPATLRPCAASESFEVRGELYLSDANLALANNIREKSGKKRFSNARNGVAGMVNKQDGTYNGLLSFAAYGTDHSPESDHLAQMDNLSLMGFRTAYELLPESVHQVREDNGLMAAVEQLRVERPTIGFLLDGAVLKVGSPAERKRLGDGSRAPKWAVAFKYPPVEGTTVIEDIELFVGKTGRLSIRAQFTPVEVDGSVLSYASLHNVGWLLEKDIRIGDTVDAWKANDIIPQVSNPRTNLRGPESTPWEAPEGCPQCGEPFDKSTELWRCNTPECSVVGRIKYAVSRDAGLDIEGLGGSIAEALVDAGLVSDVADLFQLTETQLKDLVTGRTAARGIRKLGPKNAAKIMGQIEQAKSQPLGRVITSLSMRFTGRTFGRRLAAHFHTMHALRAASVADLAAVDGIGENKATVIFSGLAANADVLDRLEAAGVSMGDAVQGGFAPLAGQTYVISGTVPGYTRSAAQDRVEALGGRAAGSVSASTTALVTNETTTSKAIKAATLGISVIDPTDFVKLLEG